MAEPIPPLSSTEPVRTARWRCAWPESFELGMVLQVALGLRLLAAAAIDLYVHRGGSARLCLFPDTVIYWGLARTIRAGARFEYVEWSDIPHFALRTPGYPVFLAGCQAIFGDRTLAVRLVQAVLGTISVYLVYRLTQQVIRSNATASMASGMAIPMRCWPAPLIAAAIAAVNPYYVLMSSLILSEAVFVPLMVAVLWGLAVLWQKPGEPGVRSKRTAALVAASSGAAAGLAILVRPSWALFLPVILAAWIVSALGDRAARIAALRGAVIFLLGVSVTMAPWWVRNARIYGRFVPTALWMGASLYDGINPRATGASDMSFLGDREIWPLDEQDQDAELTHRALAFARQNPGQVLKLAANKLGRYWSPWPGAVGFHNRAIAGTSALIEVPLLALIAWGAWNCRRDLRGCAILAGPLLYFCLLHLVFASSVRYRIPAEVPAAGLAAIGWSHLIKKHAS